MKEQKYERVEEKNIKKLIWSLVWLLAGFFCFVISFVNYILKDYMDAIYFLGLAILCGVEEISKEIRKGRSHK